MSEELGKLKAENSEMKAKQLMSQFQSQGMQGMAGLMDANTKATKDDEIKQLKQ